MCGYDRYFLDKYLENRLIDYCVWSIHATTGLVKLGLNTQNITNNIRTFYSIKIAAQTTLLRSAASYLGTDSPNHSSWSWNNLNTSGYPVSGTPAFELISKF